ncbi:hypothetical protein D3C72_1796130 [compost metagenome]
MVEQRADGHEPAAPAGQVFDALLEGLVDLSIGGETVGKVRVDDADAAGIFQLLHILARDQCVEDFEVMTV